ncbi:ricin-type beta-trefoil lectin domain protein [Streptomyces sp. NPDC059477]|uniref:ricin-type beta-trefoil lectin domain protein n=1 Tax=Streptomyces sp. NPDC059477 TaxID=3346847 RepID=UPI003685E3DE
MLDAGSSNSPDPVPHLVGELLDRHWAAAFAYARLCTDGSRAAGILTTAAFTRLFGQLPARGAPSPLWRQRLLIAVRRIAAEWGTDDRRAMLAPELRGDTDRRGPVPLLPSTERRLIAVAFQRLPEPARALLWHTEVESDPLSVPAALLDLDEPGADLELRRARERLRAECVQAHHELAPSPRCGHFSRMLDVSCLRGGTGIDPDLGTHLDACPHCRNAADQLRRFHTDLGTVLAEAVLGWGARPYVAARAARAAHPSATGQVHADLPPRPADPPLGAVPSPRHAPAAESLTAVPTTRRAPRAPAPRVAARRAAARRRNRAAALFTVGALVALPLGLWAANGSGEGVPVAAGTPDTDRPEPSADPSGFENAAAPESDVRGRLHNVASGLCLTVADGEVAKDAGTELAPCGDDMAQQWSYETDGLLRSAADPGLCVDSRIGHSVRLAACTDAKAVRYDFSRQGALIPRWDQDLALAPAATDGSGTLMVKLRDGGQTQRWVFDTSHPDLRMAAVNRDTVGGLNRPPETTTPTPTPSRTTTPPRAAPAATTSPPSAQPPTEYPCYPHHYCDGFDDDHDGGGEDGGGGGGRDGNGRGAGGGGRDGEGRGGR